MTTYSINDLEILLATTDQTDWSFLEAIFPMPIEDIPYKVLVVHQSEKKELQSWWDHIRVMNEKSYGLSKSRNAAISNSRAPICWLLDDDCKLVPNAGQVIIDAHNQNSASIICFQTLTDQGLPFFDYPTQAQLLTKKQIRKVLSPEITFKRAHILDQSLNYDSRFGLGAQFQDSENYLFLDAALKRALKVFFIPEYVVQHESLTSSDQVTSDRLIYARGALAARRNRWTAVAYKTKYMFFLYRKAYITSLTQLLKKAKVFQRGIDDYLNNTKEGSYPPKQ